MPKTKTPPSAFQAVQPGVMNFRGNTKFVFTTNLLIEDASPAEAKQLRNMPLCFREIKVQSAPRQADAPVETTTAAPGEKRDVKAPSGR